MKLPKKIEEILLRRKQILVVKNKETTESKKLVFLAELTSLGYEPVGAEKYNDSLLRHFSTKMQVLKELKAGNVDYVPLFVNFPDELPDDEEIIYKKALIQAWSSNGMFEVGQTLEDGSVIPEWLVDFSDYGANVFTQRQTQSKEVFYESVRRQAGKKSEKGNRSLTKIYFMTEEEAYQKGLDYLNQTLTSKSSINSHAKTDIESLIDFYGISNVETEKVTHREIKSFLSKYFWLAENYKNSMRFVSTSTDLLRLFAALTDSDTSLSTSIKFPKFTRKQRKIIIAKLNTMTNLCEDLYKYKNLWIALSKGLHVGEYKNKFPQAFKAFNILRNKKVETWNKKLEESLISGNIENCLAMLQKRPGEFARRLHFLLRIAEKQNKVLLVTNAFNKVAQDVPVKTLIVLEKYLQTFDEMENRTFFNKFGKIKIIENSTKKLKEKTRKQTIDIIKNSVVRSLSKVDETWEGKNVWVDDRLVDYIVPLQLRTASKSLLNYGKGTKIDLKDSKVLRLFLWWKEVSERTDLDLSLIQFDENMNCKGQVSYTNLRSGKILHSGDITSAPHGAAEFIDIDMEYVKSQNIRYLTPMIYKFSGSPFSDLDECYAGWMHRDKTNSQYKTFDASTVENAFKVSSNLSYSIPMVVDFVEGKIIYTDLYCGNRPSINSVETSLNSVSKIVEELVKLNETKPNMFDLARYNSLARKANLIEDKKQADITIGFDDCDYSVNDTEKILSEFLI